MKLKELIDSQNSVAISKIHRTKIRTLINAPLDYKNSVAINQYGLFPIHYAAQNGCLDIIKYFVSINSDALYQVDKYRRTALYWAAVKGHTAVVDFILTKHKELNNPLNLLIAPDYAALLLSEVMSRRYYAIALKLTDSYLDRQLLFQFIKSSEAAAELIMLEPRLAHTLFNDSRIAALIQNNSNIKYTDSSINWYKPKGRRNSWFAQIDTAKETTSVFTEEKELGTGTTGLVRLFSNPKGEKIAVKSFINDVENTTEIEEKNLVNYCEIDAHFTKHAYNKNHPDKIFEFKQKLENKNTLFNIRYIMPLVEGATSWALFPTITNATKLAQIVLKITEELIRLNTLGIIIGDLNPCNIIINTENNTDTVQLVDLETSYYLTTTYAHNWGELSPEQRVWIPPELCNTNIRVKPDTNQNAYSLGYILNLLLAKHPCHSQDDLNTKFPSIKHFITQAQSFTPSERPTLPSFQKKLSQELNAQLNPTITEQANTTTQTSSNSNNGPSNTSYANSLGNTLWSTGSTAKGVIENQIENSLRNSGV